MINWGIFQLFLCEQLGKPYKYGVENKEGVLHSKFQDCAEMYQMAFAYVGIKIPDWARRQYEESIPIPIEQARLGDLGFFKKGDEPAHHVGGIFNEFYICEARGKPFNRVILRPRSRWENWKDFTGYRRPLAVIHAEK